MGNVLAQTLLDGPVLALTAMGMTLVFGVLRFANVFQVDMATLGGYGTYLLMAGVGFGLLLSSVISVVVVAVIGVLLYYGLFNRLLRRNPTTAMIGSLALSILVEALIQTVAGPQPRTLPIPLERGLTFLGSAITPYQIGVIIVGAVVSVAVVGILRFTSLGRQVRAVASNRELAEASGINSRRVVNVVWIICSAVGAISGILLAIETQITVNMGFNMLLPVFAAALLGGFGSAGGAVLGGYLLAFAQAGVLQINWGALVGHSALLPTNYGPAVGFVVLLVVLVLRPQGLLGRAARRA